MREQAAINRHQLQLLAPMRERNFYRFNVSVNDRPHAPTSLFQHHARLQHTITWRESAYPCMWYRVHINYDWHFTNTISCAGRRSHACATMWQNGLGGFFSRVHARLRALRFSTRIRATFCCRLIYDNPSGQWFLCVLCNFSRILRLLNEYEIIAVDISWLNVCVVLKLESNEHFQYQNVAQSPRKRRPVTCAPTDLR